MTTRENAQTIINMATKQFMQYDACGSAEICINDANILLAEGNFSRSGERALKALAYIVGVFHDDYTIAKKLL